MSNKDSWQYAIGKAACDKLGFHMESYNEWYDESTNKWVQQYIFVMRNGKHICVDLLTEVEWVKSLPRGLEAFLFESSTNKVCEALAERSLNEPLDSHLAGGQHEAIMVS